MARFRFSLQPALDRARANEAAARTVVVDARLTWDAAVTRLAAVETRLSEVRAGAGGGGGARDAGTLAATEAAAIALTARSTQSADAAREASALLARARECYAGLAGKRRVLEALLERRLREHRLLEERAEAAAADESNALRSSEGGRPALRSSSL